MRRVRWTLKEAKNSFLSSRRKETYTYATFMAIFTYDYVDNFAPKKTIESRLLWEKRNFPAEETVFTFITPTYKRAIDLLKTFEEEARQTTKQNYEIIICDDDPDFANLESSVLIKQAAERLSRPNLNVRYYKNEKNLQQTANWNRLLELAKGQYLVMCHDDDWVERTILEAAEPYLFQGHGVAFQIRNCDFRKNTFAQKIRAFILSAAHLWAKLFFSRKARLLSNEDLFVHFMNPGCSGVVFETKKLIEMGGFSQDAFPLTDQHAFTNYAMKYGMVYVKKIQSDYRIENNDSLSGALRFPAARYNFMLSMIPHLEGDPEKLKKQAISVYIHYCHDAAIFWGVDESKMDPIDVEIDFKNKKAIRAAKKAARKIDIQAAKRYF